MNPTRNTPGHTTIVTAALVLGLAAAATPSPPLGKQWEFVGPLLWETDHHDGGEENGELGEEREGSGAWVRRNRNSIDGRVVATELTPGHVYTVHFYLFNNPDACRYPAREGLRCGLVDLFSNSSAGGAFLWADGQLARKATVEFRAHRKVKTTSRVWIGTGLTNPAGAEISFDLFDMGQPIPDHVQDQRTSATFGCGPGEPNHEGSIAGFCRDVAGNGM